MAPVKPKAAPPPDTEIKPDTEFEDKLLKFRAKLVVELEEIVQVYAAAYERAYAQRLLGPLADQGLPLCGGAKGAAAGRGPTSHVHYLPFLSGALEHFGGSEGGTDLTDCRVCLRACLDTLWTSTRACLCYWCAVCGAFILQRPRRSSSACNTTHTDTHTHTSFRLPPCRAEHRTDGLQ